MLFHLTNFQDNTFEKYMFLSWWWIFGIIRMCLCLLPVLHSIEYCHLFSPSFFIFIIHVGFNSYCLFKKELMFILCIGKPILRSLFYLTTTSCYFLLAHLAHWAYHPHMQWSSGKMWPCVRWNKDSVYKQVESNV